MRYDTVVKDLFQKDRPTLLGKLAGPAEVRELLNSELPIVEERITDFLLAMSDGALFHLDPGGMQGERSAGGCWRIRRPRVDGEWESWRCRMGGTRVRGEERAIARHRLAGLCQLSTRFTMEVRNMGVHVEVEKNAFLREIRDSGPAQGTESILQSQLECRFGPLSLWGSERLSRSNGRR